MPVQPSATVIVKEGGRTNLEQEGVESAGTEDLGAMLSES